MELFTPVYSPGIVLLSIGIAFIGCYITICLCEQFRKMRLPDNPPSLLLGSKGLLVTMSVSLGGIAIWSMHFVGMFSMRLIDSNHQRIKVRYESCKTLVSLAAVVLMACAGLFVSSCDIMFGKTKQEILELYINHASRLSISEIKQISASRMIWIISTHSLGYLVCGGCITGTGVSVMHYLGMWAIEFDNGKVEWNVGIVAASVAIAVVASTAAFWILFRLLSLYPRWESLRVLSAVVMAVAVSGMHYTGIIATTFKQQSEVDPPLTRSSISSSNAFVGAELASVLLSFVLLIVVVVETRSQYHLLAVELKRSRGAEGVSLWSQHRVMSRQSSRFLGNDLEQMTSNRKNNSIRLHSIGVNNISKKFSNLLTSKVTTVVPVIGECKDDLTITRDVEVGHSFSVMDTPSEG